MSDINASKKNPDEIGAVLGKSAESWLLIAGFISIIHHADHVLRHDHSGWPFIEEVTTFTYSLAVYPLIALVFLLNGWPRIVSGLAFILALAPTLAHSIVETPLTQYATWANRPDVNLLGVSSPVLGVLAGIITILLSVTAALAFIGFLRQAQHHSLGKD